MNKADILTTELESLMLKSLRTRSKNTLYIFSSLLFQTNTSPNYTYKNWWLFKKKCLNCYVVVMMQLHFINDLLYMYST